MVDRTIRISVDSSGATPKLRDLERRLERVETSTVSLDQRTKAVSRGMRSGAREFDRYGRAAAANATRVDRFNRELRETQASSQVAVRGLAGIRTGIGQLLALTAGAASISGFIGEIQRLEGINRNLAAFTDDVAGANEYLFDTAERLGVSYKSLGNAYGDFLLLQRSGITTQQQSQQLLEGFSALAVSTGVSTDALGRGITGLTQLLTGPAIVSAEEYKQVVENIPAAQLAVAESLGKTTGELNRLARSSQLTKEAFLSAATEGLGTYVDLAENAGDSTRRAFNDLSTAYSELVAVLQAPVGGILIGVARFLEQSIDGFRILIGEVRNFGDTLDNIADPTGIRSIAETVEQFDTGRLKSTADTLNKLYDDRQRAVEKLNRLQAESRGEILTPFATDEEIAADIQRFEAALLEADRIIVGLQERSDRANAGALVQQQREAAEQEKTIAENRAKSLAETQAKADAKRVAAARKTEAQINEIRYAINPDTRGIDEFNQRIEFLDEQIAGAGSQRRIDALEELKTQLTDTFAENGIEDAMAKINEFNRLINSSTEGSNAFEDWRTDVELLNNALDEFPQKADAIRQALARTNANFLGEITGEVSTASPADGLKEEYDQRRAILLQYQAQEGADVQAGNEALIQLAQKYAADKRTLLETQANSEFDARRQSIAESISQERTDAQHRYDLIVANGGDVESAQMQHQERMASIRRLEVNVEELRRQLEQGLITRKEYNALVEEEQTRHAQALASVEAGTEDARINAAVGRANQLLGLYQSIQQSRVSAAQQEARQLFELAENASGDERELLTQQAQDAEARAKRRFDKEKEAGKAQAKLMQALAVGKALSTSSTWYDAIINAGVAYYEGQKVIDQINATQFSGGGSLSAVSISGGSSGSTGGSDNANLVNGQDIGTGPGNTFNIFTADEIIDKEKLKETYVTMTDELSRNGTFQGVQVNSVD